MLTPELVASAFELFGDEVPTTAEAADYVRLLGDREELIAYLALKRQALDRSPEIKGALLSAALANVVVPQTPRREQSDLLARRQTELEVMVSTRELIEDDRERADALRRLEESEMNRFRLGTGTPSSTWPARYYADN